MDCQSFRQLVLVPGANQRQPIGPKVNWDLTKSYTFRDISSQHIQSLSDWYYGSLDYCRYSLNMYCWLNCGILMQGNGKTELLLLKLSLSKLLNYFLPVSGAGAGAGAGASKVNVSPGRLPGALMFALGTI